MSEVLLSQLAHVEIISPRPEESVAWFTEVMGLEETTRDGARVRIYRATFGTTPLRCTFTLSPDGKIAGLGISPDN